MKWSITVLMMVSALASFSVWADDSVEPADQAPQAAKKFGDSVKASQAGTDTQSADNFGSQVSAEAKKLKAEGGDAKKNFGKWVSSQRRKDAAHRADASLNHGADSDASEASAHGALRNGSAQGGDASGAATTHSGSGTSHSGH